MDFNRLKGLIQHEFPHLAKHGVAPVSSDWDYESILVDGEWVFRFPINKDAALALIRENIFLPDLIPSITIPIPYPSWYPPENVLSENQFQGAPLLNGDYLDEDSFKSLIKNDVRGRVSSGMSSFFSSMHRFPIKQARLYNIPERFGKIYWRDYYSKVRTDLFPSLNAPLAKAIRDIFSKFLKTWNADSLPTSLIHGNLASSNILIMNQNTISCIRNFRYMSLGDPAFDFASIYLRFGEDFTKEILSKYTVFSVSKFLDRIKTFYIYILPIESTMAGIKNKIPEQKETGLAQLKSIL
jgi:aminoglycoside 2''-phosphotransferase